MSYLANRRKAFSQAQNFLCHFDGSDAATSATDIATDGQAPHTINFSGNAQLDTAIKKWGTASLLLDGTGDNVNMGSSSDWNLDGLGSGSFTIDFQMYTTYTGANDKGVFQFGPIASSQGILNMITELTATLKFRSNGNSTTIKSLSASTWYWIAIAYDAPSETFHIYVDGTREATYVSTGQTFDASANGFYIGTYYNTTEGRDHQGSIDEFRVRRGTNGGWTTPTITTPAGPY